MVEAECPFLTWGEGTVLIPAKDGEMYSKEHGYSPSDKKLFLSDMPNYPKIFRPMHWSEQRGLGEMPRYLRFVDSPTHVLQVDTYLLGKVLFNEHVAWQPIEWYTPATEAEYLEYLKSKNNESIKRNSRTAERCKI